MKKTIKFTALLMMLAMVVTMFAACGGGSSDSAEVKGETKTWGNITVLVPENMTLKGGNALDANDPDVVNISKNDNAMNYFLITVVDSEEDAKSGVETTRGANAGSKDVTIEGTSFTGVTYEYSGMAVFQVYGKVGAKVVTVQSYGFEPNSDITKAVLSSLKIA